MMICDLCRTTEENPDGKHIHERLQQTGFTERITRAPRRGALWITRYRCEICATQWRHEDDTQFGRALWSIEHSPALAEHN